MIIDLHLHESQYSPDSRQSLDEACQRAKVLGLSGIAVTNHDNRTLALSRGHHFIHQGIHVFVGNEVYTQSGDILVFGEFSIPGHSLSNRISLSSLLRYVDERGGATIAAHPYRHNQRGIGDAIFNSPKLTAIEGYNGSTFPYDNLRAVLAARRAALPVTGAGDSHRPEKVGVFATRFHQNIESYDELIRALREGSFTPVRRTRRGYIDLSPHLSFTK